MLGTNWDMKIAFELDATWPYTLGQRENFICIIFSYQFSLDTTQQLGIWTLWSLKGDAISTHQCLFIQIIVCFVQFSQFLSLVNSRVRILKCVLVLGESLTP